MIKDCLSNNTPILNDMIRFQEKHKYQNADMSLFWNIVQSKQNLRMKQIVPKSWAGLQNKFDEARVESVQKHILFVLSPLLNQFQWKKYGYRPFFLQNIEYWVYTYHDTICLSVTHVQFYLACFNDFIGYLLKTK